jgi:hypothetical protein
MKNPRIDTEIKHSVRKTAWNVNNTVLGGKRRIAVVPYIQLPDDDVFNTKMKSEALEIALFISHSFNRT